MDTRPDETPHDDAERPERVTPDPHRGEPLPPPEEGMRPEAVAAGVRPEQDEPMGPVAELLAADVTAVEARYTDSAEAEAEAERMGVEGEGIASAQILGLMGATIVAVLIAVVAVFYLTSAEKSSATVEAEGEIEALPEGVNARNLGLGALASYGRADSSSYTIPIDRAMALVVAEYAERQSGVAGIVEPPEDRAGFNTAASNEGRAIVEGVQPMNASELGAPAVGTPQPQPVAVDTAQAQPVAPAEPAEAAEPAPEEEATVDT